MRNRKHPRSVIIVAVAANLIFASPHSPLYAENHDRNFAYISRGVFRILGASFQIPNVMLRRTLSRPLGLGTVEGALGGTFAAVSELTRGMLDVARGAAPYSKYAAMAFI